MAGWSKHWTSFTNRSVNHADYLLEWVVSALQVAKSALRCGAGAQGALSAKLSVAENCQFWKTNENNFSFFHKMFQEDAASEAAGRFVLNLTRRLASLSLCIKQLVSLKNIKQSDRLEIIEIKSCCSPPQNSTQMEKPRIFCNQRNKKTFHQSSGKHGLNHSHIFL